MGSKLIKIIIIVLILVIIVGLFWEYENDELGIFSLLNKKFISTQDLLQNPENYLNEKIGLEKVYICAKNQAIAEEIFYFSIIERTGNKSYVKMPIKYSDNLNAQYWYDLTGEVKVLSNGKYYFEANKILLKGKKELSENLYYPLYCDVNS